MTWSKIQESKHPKIFNPSPILAKCLLKEKNNKNLGYDSVCRPIAISFRWQLFDDWLLAFPVAQSTRKSNRNSNDSGLISRNIQTRITLSEMPKVTILHKHNRRWIIVLAAEREKPEPVRYKNKRLTFSTGSFGHQLGRLWLKQTQFASRQKSVHQQLKQQLKQWPPIGLQKLQTDLQEFNNSSSLIHVHLGNKEQQYGSGHLWKTTKNEDKISLSFIFFHFQKKKNIVFHWTMKALASFFFFFTIHLRLRDNFVP